jgi:predicted DNA-binding protein with PD1-like motif
MYALVLQDLQNVMLSLVLFTDTNKVGAWFDTCRGLLKMTHIFVLRTTREEEFKKVIDWYTYLVH